MLQDYDDVLNLGQRNNSCKFKYKNWKKFKNRKCKLLWKLAVYPYYCMVQFCLRSKAECSAIFQSYNFTNTKTLFLKNSLLNIFIWPLVFSDIHHNTSLKKVFKIKKITQNMSVPKRRNSGGIFSLILKNIPPRKYLTKTNKRIRQRILFYLQKYALIRT